MTEQSSAAKLPEIRTKAGQTELIDKDKRAKTFAKKRSSQPQNVRSSPRNRLTVERINREPDFAFTGLNQI